MKRIGNLYEKIYSIDNLRLADQRARKGKKNQFGVKEFDKNAEINLLNLQNSLIDKTYNTSEYKVFKIFDPKERDIFKLPYFPDRICHHAVINIMESIFVSVFTKDTYSCIKGRGIHKASTNLRVALKDKENTKYCLKLDIRKFYPNIDHDILKDLLRRKVKDKDLLWLLDNIIDSAPGCPIGNYLSQYFANFYLTYFDHWIKENKSVKHYFRYADDIVILHRDKAHLHKLLFEIKEYMKVNLKLDIKDNYQIFPVEARGIDFVGYVHYHSHTRVRKSIKVKFCKRLSRNRSGRFIPSYYGWLIHGDTKNLLRKLQIDATLFKNKSINNHDKRKTSNIFSNEVCVL